LDDPLGERPRRILPRIDEFAHRHVDTIRYGDLDRQGHVNNSVFATFLESGRVHVFRDDASGLSIPGGEFVLARLELDFLRELKWPGEVEIGTGIARIGRSSVVLDQALFNEDKCAAVAKAVMVLIDPSTRRPRPFPDDAVAKMRSRMRGA
jgi:acyl-CoA thioester hydrolase